MKEHKLTAGGHRLVFGTSGSGNHHIGWTDGSVRKGKMGAGGVLENQETGSRETYACPIIDATQPDSTGAELNSLAILLMFAKERGVTKLQVGLDSFEAILHLQKYLNGVEPRYKKEVETLKNLVGEFEYLELVNIDNRKNREADNLSRSAIGLLSR